MKGKNSSRLENTSNSAQLGRLLARLQLGAVDTLTARSDLNVLHPAARIKELKERGHSISKQRITMTDEHGRTHYGIALYYLAGEVLK
jgi:hypothetical protein